MSLKEVPPELIEAFRRLGVKAPEVWAASQVREGIPQLARASLLYWLWSGVVSHRDLSWIDQQIDAFRRAESRKSGRGRVYVPHAPAMERMLSLGISREELTTLVREMQADILGHCCVVLDCISFPPEEVALDRFGVFEMDEKGEPIRRVGGLHESVCSFDRELSDRKRTAGAEEGTVASDLSDGTVPDGRNSGP